MAGHLQYQGLIGMDDTDKRLREICREIPALEVIRLEALGLASGLDGDPEKIGKAWRGRDGLQARIAMALEEARLTDAWLTDAEVNWAYDEACKRLWELLWAGRT